MFFGLENKNSKHHSLLCQLKKVSKNEFVGSYGLRYKTYFGLAYWLLTFSLYCVADNMLPLILRNQSMAYSEYCVRFYRGLSVRVCFGPFSLV